MSRSKQQHFIQPGERARIEIAYSEAAMHLRVAGKVMEIELLDPPTMVQLYTLTGLPYSFPITTGEAGVYDTEDRRHYVYLAEEQCGRQS